MQNDTTPAQDTELRQRFHDLVDAIFDSPTPQSKVKRLDELQSLLIGQQPAPDELLTDVERVLLAEAQALWPDYVTVYLSQRHPNRAFDMDANIGYQYNSDGYEADGIFIAYTPEDAVKNMREAIAKYAPKAQS